MNSNHVCSYIYLQPYIRTKHVQKAVHRKLTKTN